MATNIIGGQPNVCHGLKNIDFVSAGINAQNTALIVRIGNPLKSYVPGKAINTITGFEIGWGYYMIALTDQDLTDTVGPPFPEASSGILLEDNTPVVLE